MMTSLKAPLALIAVLAVSAACSTGGVVTAPGASAVPAADVHAAMPGHKNAKEAFGLGQPPVAAPVDPVMKPASVTFASSREFQEFPVQPVTNSIFFDHNAMNVGNEYMLPPILPAKATTAVPPSPKMIATQYREVIPRGESAIYASTFGGLIVE